MTKDDDSVAEKMAMQKMLANIHTSAIVRPPQVTGVLSP